MSHPPEDVPSPIDLRTFEDAADWEAQATSKRPWRETFFRRAAQEVAELHLSAPRVLELGSGPGFLALRVMEAIPNANYTLLDFSPAMHALAGRRLAAFSMRTAFLERDFKATGWSQGIGEFDAILTHQAVHELRHKNYAAALHRQVRQILSKRGIYLVCDHYFGDDGMTDNRLYMSVEEQRTALSSAGFKTVEKVMQHRGLALYRACA